MKRIFSPAHQTSALALTVALTTIVGCNRAEPPAETTASTEAARPAPGGAAMPEGQDLRVTGCLTAGVDGRSFALTPSDNRPTEAGQAMQMPGRDTVTYELVGNAADFEGHANTIVTAVGREDLSVARETEVEREGASEQRPASGSSDTPKVETKEEVEVNVKRLHVASVLATGDPCPSTGAIGGRATEPAAATPRPQ